MTSTDPLVHSPFEPVDRAIDPPRQKPHDWALETLQDLRGHASREQEALDAYRSIADSTDDEATRRLVQLIVDDEVRHHQLMKEMVDAIEAEWEGHAARPTTPVYRADLLRATKQMIMVEKADLAELKDLRRELRHVPRNAHALLMVELMRLDARKHLRILNFIKRAITDGSPLVHQAQAHASGSSGH